MMLISNKKLSILIIIFGLISNLAYSQLDIPVDPLTGRLLYSVPLWELKSGDLSIPIAAIYGGDGIKVAQPEGKFGMGWEISGVGAVSRVVRGLPDDLYVSSPSNNRRGWLTTGSEVSSATFTADNNLTNCDEVADYGIINEFYTYSKDTEPDLFSFNAPGLSGQFVFDASGTPRLLNYEQVQIEKSQPTSQSLINSFTIIKNDGTRYTFASKETTVRTAKKYNSSDQIDYFKTDYQLNVWEHTFTSQWLLTKIESQSGSEIIYGYDNGTASSSINDVIVYLPTGDEKKQYYIEDVTTPKILKTISGGGDLVIEFEYLNSNKCFSRVAIKDAVSGVTRKQYLPEYAYIRDANFHGNNSPTQKLFLKSIIERADFCYSFPAFEFAYYGINFTSGTSGVPYDAPNTKQDFWGYFNGNASGKRSKIYYYSFLSGTDKFRLTQHNTFTETSHTEGDDGRAVLPSLTKTGSLQSITLPSGGKTYIEYEGNQYLDVATGTNLYGPGLRVSHIWSQDSYSNKVSGHKFYEYKQLNSTTSGVMPYPPAFAFLNLSGEVIRTADDISPESMVQYSRVTVKTTGKGKTVYTFNIPSVYPSNTNNLDWNATFSKIARPSPCPSVGSIINDYYAFPYAPNTNFDFERGIPQQVVTSNEAGQAIQTNTYGYTRLGTTSIPIKAIKYEKLSDNVIRYGAYTILTNLTKVMVMETNSTADLSDINRSNTSTSTYEYDQTHFMLKTTQTTNSDGVIHKTQFKYPVDFDITSPVGTPATILKSMKDNYVWQPVVVTNSVVSGTETLTGSVLTLFDNYPYAGKDRFLPAEILTNQSTGFTEVNLSGQQLSYNGYRSQSKIENYNSEGKPVTITDRSRIPKTVLYGYGGQIPIATFTNASYKEIAYAGFETTTDFDFTTSLTPDDVMPWAGKKSLVITPPNIIERTGLELGKDKHYRFSARIQGSTAGQVNFKFYQGGVLKASGVLDYSSSDISKWVFKSGSIDLSSITGSYSLKISTSSSLRLDDILYYPQSASVAIESITPGIGPVAQGNERGQYTFWEYDQLTRLEKVRDQDKNITQLNKYYYVNQTAPSFTSNFWDNWYGDVVVGSNLLFTATNNCADVTYKWYVNSVVKQTTNTFQYEFTSAGTYIIKLEVTEGSTGTSSETSRTYIVTAPTGIGAPVVKLNADRSNIFNCDGYGNSFTASISGCYTPSNYNVEWEKKTCLDNNFKPVIGTNLSLSFDINTDTNGQPCPYWIRVRVSSVCPLDDLSHTSDWTEIYITYTSVPEGQCN